MFAPALILRAAPLLLIALGTLASAQSVRLNGPLAQPGGRDVQHDYALTPDGTTVAFRVDLEMDEVFELYAAPSDASAPALRLNGPLGNDGDVLDFVLANTHALYRADANANERFELFSVPLDASSPALVVNAPLPVGADVVQAWVSPDGALVLFSATDPSGRQRLYRAPIDGAEAPVQIADSGAPGAFTTAFAELAISQDGLYAVYRAQLLDGGTQPSGLFQVRVDGSQGPVQLGTGAGNVKHFRVSQDGSRVTFTEGSKQYAVRIDGSGRVQLSQAGILVGWLARISADGSRVVFVEGLPPRIVSNRSDGSQHVLLHAFGSTPLDLQLSPDDGHAAYNSSLGELFCVPVDVAAPVLIGSYFSGSGYLFSPDSSSLVFARTVTLPGGEYSYGLYVAPVGGGTPVLINGPQRAFRGTTFGSLTRGITAGRAVYVQDDVADDAWELHCAPLDASAPDLRLSPRFGGPRDVLSLRVVPGGERVLYYADQAEDEVHELFSVPVDGSAPPARVHPRLPGGPVIGDVSSFVHIAGSDEVLFRANADWDVFNLYVAPLDGRPLRNLTASLTGISQVVVGMDVYGVSPSGERVVLVDQAMLYVADTDGVLPPVLLDAPQPLQTTDFRFKPDETRVVYRSTTERLHSVPTDASAPAVPLHPVPAVNSHVEEFRIAPDGVTVVYRADHGQLDITEIYAVPLDASAPPLRLNAALPVGGDVTAFTLSLDGTTVVFRADAGTDELFELYAVPLDGSLPPLRLNATLPSGGDVTDFRISPDGLTVFYRADQSADETHEIFGVPLDGHAAPTLRTPVPAGRSAMGDFVLSADGTQLYYRADGGTAGAFELQRVATSGTPAPVVLSGPLVSGGTVSLFALSPDQDLVVYRADQRTDDVLELFSVSTAGGPSVLLDGMPAFGDVLSFQISPDASFIAYVADRAQDGVLELWGVPLDLGKEPRRLSGSMISGGDVSNYVVLGGGRALYLADQEADEAFELFEGFFGHLKPRRLR